MIDRYTCEPMGEIWSEENKFRKWLDVEIAACEAWNRFGAIPDRDLEIIKKKAAFTFERIIEI